MPSRRIVINLTWLFLLSMGSISSASAQIPPPASFRLASVKYTGLSRYTETQANADLGLRLGDMVTAAQLQDATDRLSKSGAFDKVSFRYVTRNNELSAEFSVRETQKVLPCVFDNFIWFSDQQLDQTLRARVPFYTGVSPENGTTSKEIATTLEQLLRTNGVTGTVEPIASADHFGGPVTALLFQVKGVVMPIRSVNFPGASVVSEKALVAASSQLIGQDYSGSNVSVFGSNGLLPIYKRRGYLRARFEKPQAKITGSSANGASLDIAVTLPVQEGSEYYWQRAEWNGNQQIPSEDLDRLLGMKTHEIANQDSIDAGLGAIKRSYETKGFLDAFIDPKIILDEAARLVSYDVNLAEGTQYHMGQVHFGGLPEGAAKELAKKWQLEPGEIYNPTYATDFVQSVALPAVLKMEIKSKSAAITAQRDRQTSSVDLNIVFH
jgi:outer membrane protein insertion porin family